MTAIKTVGIIGTGLIGTGWTVRCLARGVDVIATDPDPAARHRLMASIEKAWPAVQKLSLAPAVQRAKVRFTTDLEDVCRHADFIQVDGPAEDADALYTQLDSLARPEMIIASSSSRVLPSRIQAGCQHPERIVVGHPLDPVYLMPLVEVFGSAKTAPWAIEQACAVYESLGMCPVRVGKEIDGGLADRLQDAVWREAHKFVQDGVATPEAVDAAVTHGPGLRWALMGPHQIVQHAQSSTDQSTTDLENVYEDGLIGTLRTLRQYNLASGKTLAQDEARLYGRLTYRRWQPGDTIDTPLALYECQVNPTWVDYNGHMSESFYFLAFGDAEDALFRYVGIDEAYRGRGYSLYTAEAHINYYQAVGSGEPLRFTTQLLGTDDKRLHLFHHMYHGQTGELLSTTEKMLLHVDMNASKACPVRAEIAEAVQHIWNAHKHMPKPKQVGRQMAVHV